MFSQGGLIIRLIDVVLILLLGFIGISDFTLKTQIKLPTGSAESSVVLKQHVIKIRILTDHEYELDDAPTGIWRFRSLDMLERQLEGLQAHYSQKEQQLMVVIYPADESMIQTTVDMIDVCELLRIPRSIYYEI